MPRPKKIRKKKSFMFTSRHYSFIGNLSVVLALSSLAGMITAILISGFGGKDPAASYGGVGFFGVAANITGVIACFISFKERDIYLWVPRLALVINTADIILWILIAAWGMQTGHGF
ncbi:MAG TPA: hypothetical protein DCL38_00600 [Lachnospiraceae bacterium]|nr:hypothetical protein [Lachnospiraceae bacterium]